MEQVVDVCDVADGTDAHRFGVAILWQGDGVRGTFTTDHLQRGGGEYGRWVVIVQHAGMCVHV